ncbi:MAG: hypothetical protein ACLFPQ_06910 [Candidatus Woesearchaeota archaeon]
MIEVISLEVLIFIGLMLFIIAAIVLLKVVKHLFVAIISIIGLFLLLLAGVGFTVYDDVTDIREQITEQPSILVLQEDGNIIAAVGIDPEAETIEQGLIPLGEDDINFIEETRERDESAPLTGLKEFSPDIEKDVFKIIEFDMAVLEDAPVDEMSVEFVNLQREDVIALMRSDDLYSDMAGMVLDDPEFMEMIQSQISPDMDINLEDIEKDEFEGILKESLSDFGSGETEIKGVLFVMFTAYMVKEGGSESIEYIYSNFREKNIIIYPESITFSVLKLAPKSIIEQVISQIEVTEAEVPLDQEGQ